MAAGWWLFGEQITITKVVGIIFALISIVILSF
jgi:multidrug transporter EmrE-like cation transporter